MATKKQQREQALAKRALRLEEERLSCLAAQRKDQAKRAQKGSDDG